MGRVGSSLIAALLLLGTAIHGGDAKAYTVDTLLDSADLGNSGNAEELAAMCTAAGFAPGTCNLELDLKFDQEDPEFNVASDGAGQWVIDVAPTTPGYFLLKFGTGGLDGDPDDTYFFQNIAELTKLVFTDAQVNFITGGCGETNCNIGRLSHYATFVPVPAALPLLFTGLTGLAFLGRMRRRRAKLAA